MGPGFVQCQILVIWGPCEPPVIVAPQAQAENLKTAGSRCDMHLSIIIADNITTIAAFYRALTNR